MEVQKTALYNIHKNLGAKFVPFAGYEMPIQYKDGIVKEHISTRTYAGFFDVSHMGQFFLEGDETLTEALEKIIPADLKSLKINHSKYSFLLNNDGGIIDDLIVYRCDESEYMLVVNASNIKKDWDWLISNVKNFNCKLLNESDNIGLISVQGPKSLDLINEVFKKDFSSIKKFRFDTIIYNKSKITISNTCLWHWSSYSNFKKA